MHTWAAQVRLGESFLKKGCKVGRALAWMEDLGRISRRSGGLKIIKIQCMQIHEFSNNKI